MVKECKYQKNVQCEAVYDSTCDICPRNPNRIKG